MATPDPKAQPAKPVADPKAAAGTAPAAGAAAPAPANENSIEAVRARVDSLRQEVSMLEKQIRSLQGMIKNRDPKRVKSVQDENESLKARMKRLETAFYGSVTDMFRPRNADESNIQYELLKEWTADFFKKANVDLELWKNIAS